LLDYVCVRLLPGAIAQVAEHGRKTLDGIVSFWPVIGVPSDHDPMAPFGCEPIVS
jgi:hypothetical protein